MKKWSTFELHSWFKKKQEYVLDEAKLVSPKNQELMQIWFAQVEDKGTESHIKK